MKQYLNLTQTFSLMSKNYFFLLLLTVWNSPTLIAQSVAHVLNQEPLSKVKDFEVLADSNYIFEQVLNDSTLHFTKNKRLPFSKNIENYWVRFSVSNPTLYAESGSVIAFPCFDNTLYYYDYQLAKWQTSRAGLAVPTRTRSFSLMPCIFQANKQSVFFIKINVTRAMKFGITTPISVNLEKASYRAEREQYMMTVWLISLIIIGLFFFYNASIYFVFRDVAYLYYLMILVGGALYITGLNFFANILTSIRFFQISVYPDGSAFYFDFNGAVMQIGILVVMTGFIQFTRVYLQTSTQLPKWDRLLRYLNAVFAVILLSDILLTLSGVCYTHDFIASVINIGIVGIILLILSVGVLSHRKGFVLGRYFLIANALPLTVMACLAGYFILNYNYGNGVFMLPNAAIIAQTLAFPVALMARINLIKAELQTKHEEAQKLQQDKKEILHKNQLIEQENAQITEGMAQGKSEKAELQNQLEANQRVLATNSMYLVQKNEMLSNLKKQIEGLSKQSATQHKDVLKKIKETFDNNTHLDANWDTFKVHFEQVHPDFFKDLHEKYPLLTSNEVRLCAYFHLKLSAKEIAALLNIEPESVHRAKTRLNKKMAE